MPGIFERLAHFVFGPPPEDEISQILKRAASRGNRDYNFEQVGILVLSDGDDELAVFSPDATAESACAAIESLNWEAGINFVVAIPRSGVALELSGSLDPEDGLSFTYHNKVEGIECVSEEPPASLAEARSVLSAFLRGESSWRARFVGLGDHIASTT